MKKKKLPVVNVPTPAGVGKAFDAIAADPALTGAIILWFQEEHVGISPGACNREYAAVLSVLGTAILTAFTDGTFDELVRKRMGERP